HRFRKLERGSIGARAHGHDTWTGQRAAQGRHYSKCLNEFVAVLKQSIVRSAGFGAVMRHLRCRMKGPAAMTSCPGRDELRQALGQSRGLLRATGLFSFFANLLMLAGPLYMLQVYDRVLSSRSEATLVALTLLL